MNILPDFDKSFFKINYLHNLKNTLFTAVDLKSIVKSKIMTVVLIAVNLQRITVYACEFSLQSIHAIQFKSIFPRTF